MKKHIIFISIALFTVGTVAAQDGISKQLEVTKAYTPKVGQAAKLPIEAQMVDTARLRPEIHYSITPTAWETSFGTRKYSPAYINAVPFEKHKPLYIRAGAGYPLQSTADVYFNPYMGSGSTFGLFFNHRGSFSKIKNALGVKPKSKEMLNGGGLYGSKHFRRYKLSGDLEYDNRIYNAYGVRAVDPDFSITGMYPSYFTNLFEEQNAFGLGRVRGHVAFGDTFADLSRFNFQIGLNAGLAHGHSELYQLDLDAWARLAKMWRSRHGLEIGLSERGAIGLGDGFSQDNASTVRFSPRYLLSLRKFSMRVGVDVAYVNNKTYGQDHISIVPQLEATLNIAKGYFTPYLTLTSDMVDGSFEALSRRNPYNTYQGATGWTHDIRLGFSGNAGNVFSYRIQGGISWLEDYSIFCGYQRITAPNDGSSDMTTHYPLTFIPSFSDGMKYTVGAELGLHNLGGFSMKIAGNWYKADMDHLPVSDLPKYDASVELMYSYKDKFSISAGTKLIGERDFITTGVLLIGSDIFQDAGVNKISAAADVFANVDIKITDGFNIFVEGRNLANRKLYPYNYYRGLGANVMAGVKLLF